MYKDTLRLAMLGGVKKLGLFHHDPDRTDAGVNEIVDDCRRIIAAEGSNLECFAVTSDQEMHL